MLALVLLNIVFTIALFAGLLYAFYKIDQSRTQLQANINELHAKFSKLINAINAVNQSEFQLDMVQQEQIDRLK